MDAAQRLILHQPVLYPPRRAQASETLILHDAFDDVDETVLADHVIAPIKPDGVAWNSTAHIISGNALTVWGEPDLDYLAGWLEVAGLSNARVVATLTGACGNSATPYDSGLVVRLKSANPGYDAYVIGYNDQDDAFRIVHSAAYVDTILASEISIPINNSLDHVIEVTIQDGTITATLDGAHQISVDGLTFAPDAIGYGVHTGGYGVVVKDFKVYAL